MAFFWFSGKWVIDGIPRVDLYYYFVPIVIVLIGSYFVADMFFDVYEMAVDTTFICFCKFFSLSKFSGFSLFSLFSLLFSRR